MSIEGFLRYLNGEYRYFYYFINSIWFALAAYWLHNPKWRDDHLCGRWLNGCCGWLILLITIVTAIFATKLLLQQSFMQFLGNPLLWLFIPTFSMLALASIVRLWHEARNSLLIFLPLFTLHLLVQVNIANYPFATASVLIAGGLLHLFILHIHSEQENIVSILRIAGLIVFTILWSKLCGQLGLKHLHHAWCITAWIVVPTIMHFYLLKRSPLKQQEQGIYQIVAFLLLGTGWTYFTGKLGEQYLNNAWQIGAWLLIPTLMHLYILRKDGVPRSWQFWHHSIGFLLLGIGWTLFINQLGWQYLGGAWAQLATLLLPLATWIILDKKTNTSVFKKTS